MTPVTFVSQLETTQRTLIVKKSKDAGITFFQPGLWLVGLVILRTRACGLEV